MCIAPLLVNFRERPHSVSSGRWILIAIARYLLIACITRLPALTRIVTWGIGNLTHMDTILSSINMADDLPPAFVDHYVMNHRERCHEQTCSNHSETSAGSSPDVMEVTDAFFSGSLDGSSSKELGTKLEQIHEIAVNGLKQHTGVLVTSVHRQIKLHSKSVQAPKMQPDRTRKDIKEEDVSAVSSDTLAYAPDLTSLRSGGVERSEMSGVSSRSMLQSVPSEVLELICKGLSPFDLCCLCQVNRYHREVCNREEFWSSRVDDMKIDLDLCSKENVLSAERRKVSVQPLVEHVRLKGDFVITDPFSIFRGSLESARLELLHHLHRLQQQNHWVFLVQYLNHIAYFISADNYDPEPAFEISRDGTILGVHEHPSKFIGVFTKEMADRLLKESGQGKGISLDGGVVVEGVDGELICSGDGDFVISGSPLSRGRKVSRWIEDDCVRFADILCAAGGRWTFCDDTSEEEDEDGGDGEITDEETEMCFDQKEIGRSGKQDLDHGWNRQGPYDLRNMFSKEMYA